MKVRHRFTSIGIMLVIIGVLLGWKILRPDVFEFNATILGLSVVLGLLYGFRKTDKKRSLWQFAMRSSGYFMAVSLTLQTGMSHFYFDTAMQRSIRMMEFVLILIAVIFFIYAAYNRKPWETLG